MVFFRAAEDRLKALEATNEDVDVKAQLLEANKQLEEYKSVFGSASVDVQSLSEQLRQKEAEIQNLRLQQTQQEQVRITVCGGEHKNTLIL
jgi:E3 ubiquitin-protein ligase BRE1